MEAIISCFLALDRAADSLFFIILLCRLSIELLNNASTFERVVVWWWFCSSCKSLCARRSKWNSGRELRLMVEWREDGIINEGEETVVLMWLVKEGRFMSFQTSSMVFLGGLFGWRWWCCCGVSSCRGWWDIICFSDKNVTKIETSKISSLVICVG